MAKGGVVRYHPFLIVFYIKFLTSNCIIKDFRISSRRYEFLTFFEFEIRRFSCAYCLGFCTETKQKKQFFCTEIIGKFRRKLHGKYRFFSNGFLMKKGNTKIM